MCPHTTVYIYVRTESTMGHLAKTLTLIDIFTIFPTYIGNLIAFLTKAAGHEDVEPGASDHNAYAICVLVLLYCSTAVYVCALVLVFCVKKEDGRRARYLILLYMCVFMPPHIYL